MRLIEESSEDCKSVETQDMLQYVPSVKAVMERPEDFTAEEIQNALDQANARFLGEDLGDQTVSEQGQDEDDRLMQEKKATEQKLKTLSKRYPSMLIYEVENEVQTVDINVKAHAMAIMTVMRRGVYNYYKLNAIGSKNIQKCELMLELLNKWIFVEEIFHTREVKDPNPKAPAKPKVIQEQLHVVFSRSYDFGEKFITAK